MTQQHGLTWGALDFVDTTPTDDGWIVEAIADGTEFGNPEAIIETVKSLLLDGSLAVRQNWDNRTITLRVRVSALSESPGPALAAGEAALMAEVLKERPEPLKFTPPTDDAEPSVFDVVVADLDRDYDADYDSVEVLQEQRYYILTLTCLPFVRPDTSEVSVGSPADPNPPETIDTCDSLANWTADPGATLSQSSGHVRVTRGSVKSTSCYRGSLPALTRPYLRVIATRVSGDFTAFLNGDTGEGLGVTHSEASSEVGGATDYYIPAPTGMTTLGCRVSRNVAGTVTLDVHQIDLVDGPPGMARQGSRGVVVAGSAPTQAAIRVYDPTPAALGGDVLVYSSRSAANPALRSRRVSSATVTGDGAMVSGSRNTLTSAMVFEIPADQFEEATHSLMARMDVTVAGELTWSARMVDSAGATTVGSSVVATDSVSLAVTSGYQVVRLGAMTLPVVAVEADQMVELTLTGTANMTIDEAWLFDLDNGALTWVVDSDSLTWIEIRSPQLDAARPSVFGGTGDFDENGVCIDWKCGSFGAHQFDPGPMYLFVVTSSSTAHESAIEFYPRYHSHVL